MILLECKANYSRSQNPPMALYFQGMVKKIEQHWVFQTEGTLTWVLDDLKSKGVTQKLITVGKNCHHGAREQRRKGSLPEPGSLEEALCRAGSPTSEGGA